MGLNVSVNQQALNSLMFDCLLTALVPNMIVLKHQLGSLICHAIDESFQE